MPSEREIIEKAAVKAHDLREEARFVRLFGREYHVKPPMVIDLEPSGALIEGQISGVVTFGGDFQSHYRIQVDGHGVIANHESDEQIVSTGWHQNDRVLGLSLIGSFDDVLVRLNETSINDDKNKALVKLSVGIAWAYARAAQLRAPDPVFTEAQLLNVALPLQGIAINRDLGIAEDPDAGGETSPQPQ